MSSPVLVTGGTGRLGSLVLQQLIGAGADVRVLTRQSRSPAEHVHYCTGDLSKDVNLDAAVHGVAAILHCATEKKGDVDATRHLVRAAARSGAPHLVYVSIVGIDNIASWGYPKAKLQTEQVVSESGLPWTILRATQFYSYVLSGLRTLTKPPIAFVPAGFRVQPVDAEDVATRLAALAVAKPAGRVPDLAGPDVTDWAALMRDYLRASHRRRRVVPVRIPGTRAVRAGGLLPPAEHVEGHRTWEQFLAENLHCSDAPTRRSACP
jgi:uncharacterized protein YbjT (DUF2867 family)